MEGRFARVWYRFRNWFRKEPGPGEPLRFLCGSEEELRRVTMWICHIHAHLFQGRDTVVRYEAKSDFGDGGSLGLHLIDEQNLQLMQDVYKQTKVWFTLAFEQNQFTGTVWAPEIIMGTPPSSGVFFYLFSRHSEMPGIITVCVQPPSAHERAEALLALSEWLDGKVSEQEKRELLQLTDDIEI